jgi:hypothetical protein
MSALIAALWQRERRRTKYWSCAVHATKDHNMKPEEVTEELKNKIRANIHKSWF